MTISKSQKRLFILLGAVLAFAIIDIILNKEQYTQFYFKESNAVDQTASQVIKLKKVSPVPLAKNIDMNWKRDPFLMEKEIPVRNHKKSLKVLKLKLQAITYSDKNSFVMINDLILKEGEFVEGYQVKQILKNRVRLLKNGKSIYLQSN